MSDQFQNADKNNDETAADRRRRFIRYALLVAWLVFIFVMSSGRASAAQTSRFIRPLLEFVFAFATPETIDLLHELIRKMAHVFEYAVAGFLAARAFAGRPAAMTVKRMLAALALTAVVAALDELNQSFDPTRIGSPLDVLIDIVGGIIGVLLAKAVSAVSLTKRNANL